MTIEAKVVLDSISPDGIRLTTMQLRYPKMIHGELMTHRVFSRNASSSRAIPVERYIEQIRADPAMPVAWGKNQKGMQAQETIEDKDAEEAKRLWLEGREFAAQIATRLAALGVHKQLANRVIEPWVHISVVVTSTEWENFYGLRDHKDAQPEMKFLAETALDAHRKSEPQIVDYGYWHLPYVDIEKERLSGAQAAMASVARCARVSYLNHDGTNPDILKDMELHHKLKESGHWSPFEHQATPLKIVEGNDDNWSGNFYGWKQYRKTFQGENRNYHKLGLVSR